MINSRLITLLVLFLMVIQLGYSQESKLEKANRLYNQLEFYDAIPMYKELLKDGDDIGIKEKLANSYRLINDTRNAEDWLQEVVKSGASDEVYKLFYGQTLMENEKYAEAEYWLSQYVSSNPSHSQASNLLYAAQNISGMKASSNACNIQQLPKSVNSKCSDIGPAFYGDGLMFSSDCDSAGLKYLSSWTGRSFYDLFTTTANGGNDYTDRKRGRYGSVGTNRFHEGPVSFSSDEQTMYYTRNDYSRNSGLGRDAGGTVRLKVYEAEMVEGKWETVDSLAINNSEYSVAHPALSSDGMRLYVSSDMPGGYGGMDLYVMERLGDGWGSAVNLGPEVNTEGDEVFPFSHGNGNLYFSSDGLATCGGLDIFRISTGIGGTATGSPINMGSPINTSKDDFGYILNTEETKGYLSSNRNETRIGDDDIYSHECESYYMRGVVVDCETDNAISGASVNVPGIGSTKTGSDGSFVFEVSPGMNYEIEGMKDGYISNMVSASTMNMSGGEELFVKVPLCLEPVCEPAGTACDDGDATTIGDVEDGNCNCAGYVPAPESECFVSGRVYDESTGGPINGARVRIRDNSSGYEQEAFTGLDGYYSFKNEGGDYSLTSSTECYYSETKTASYGECNISVDFPLRPILVGSVSLLHIYYDLDKSYIRPDAEVELSNLLRFMEENPSVTVELGSHTDSRGSDGYNADLSQRRADSVRDWLITRGVDASRITSVGYGESQLVNNCSNGVSCTDSEHEKNRRTEFRITGGCGGSVYSNPTYTDYVPTNPYTTTTTTYSIDK